MTSGNGLLEVGLPIATEFSTQIDEAGADYAPVWMPWQSVEQAGEQDEDPANDAALLGPQNGRKRYDDDDGETEDEVEFDVDDDEADDAVSDDDADDDDFDDDEDDDLDDDDDDDADDFDDD